MEGFLLMIHFISMRWWMQGKKAKYIRLLNPDTHPDTQGEILYSGPTVFFNKDINIKDKDIIKMDLKSAYLSYLINEQINKPGIFRIKHEGAIPLSERVALYVVKFNCSLENMFVKWFLNSSAITMKKIKTDGSRVWGEIGIFSNVEMNLIKYINIFFRRWRSNHHEIIHLFMVMSQWMSKRARSGNSMKTRKMDQEMQRTCLCSPQDGLH